MNFKLRQATGGLWLFFLLGMCCLFLSNCKKENRCDCFKRTGDMITENRYLSGFTKLSVEDNVSVFVTQDSVFEVLVEAGKNIAPLIKTEVIDGTLVCKNNNRCNWTRSYKNPLNIHVRMPFLTEITSNGTGLIKTLNKINASSFLMVAKNSGDVELLLNTNKLTTIMHGSADVYVWGNAQEHYCNTGGSGFLNAGNFYTDYTYIHSNTLGLCYIYVASLLDCRLDQKGDIFCYGKPHQINQKKTSSGKLYIQ